MNEKTVERRQPGWTTIKIKPPLKGKGFIREVALSQLSSSLITVWWCLAKSALGQKKISRLLSTCCERFFNPLRSSWFIHSDASLRWKVFLKMVQTSLPFKIFFLTISIPLVSCCSSTRYVCFFQHLIINLRCRKFELYVNQFSEDYFTSFYAWVPNFHLWIIGGKVPANYLLYAQEPNYKWSCLQYFVQNMNNILFAEVNLMLQQQTRLKPIQRCSPWTWPTVAITDTCEPCVQRLGLQGRVK